MHPQVPNALTVARIGLALAFPLTPPRLRLPLLLAALATEYLDGAISRKYHLESRFGRLLDPIADKVLFAAVAATFVLEGRLALWELGSLAIRDLAVAAWATKLALLRDWAAFASMRPDRLGKATTSLQYACLVDLLLEPRLFPPLLAATALCGALAAREYYLTQVRRPP